MWGVPVLVALTPADTARQLENMTDAEVVQDAMRVRRQGSILYRLESSVQCLHAEHGQTNETSHKSKSVYNLQGSVLHHIY